MNQDYRPRLIDEVLERRLQTAPAVLLAGARGIGKSTSAGRQVNEVRRLDVPAEAQPFRSDPDAALARIEGPLLLDEWQEVPEVLWAVKRAVDAGADPGSYILTGSVTPRITPDAPKPTFGRLAHLTMRSAHQREVHDQLGNSFRADDFFETDPNAWPASTKKWVVDDYVQAALTGGYPTVAFATADSRQWYDDYSQDVVATARQALSPRIDEVRFEQWLTVCAEQSGQLPNEQTLLDLVGVNRKTGERYDDIVQSLYLQDRVPAWFTNRLKRLAKASKRYLTDSGLMGSLQDVDEAAVLNDAKLTGHLLDTFVAQQLRIDLDLGNQRTRMYHYRDGNGRREVDLLLERKRKIVAVEVTASAAVAQAKIDTMAYLRDALGDQFHRGVILNTGRDLVQHGDKVYSAPISLLWS